VPAEEEIKKVSDIIAEIEEYITKVVGKINSLDSKTDRANVCSQVMNRVVAGAELSRIEKVGILAMLLNQRIKG